MTGLVFGRSGQVATELQRQGRVLALGRGRVDLGVPDACAEAIRAIAPDFVINAAAWTAVDAAEDQEADAHAINAVAPGVMARTCADLGIPFVHISTDYIFDGSGDAPWRETDSTSPLCAYGRSKLAGEQAVCAAGGAYLVLRTSWVFSAHGQNFVKTMLRLGETRDHLTVVADQVGGPTPAADIAATLLRLAEMLRGGAQGGTYHYAGAPATSWAGFARAIFAAAGLDVTVKDIPSSDYPTPARRPLNSRLDGAALKADFGIDPPDWPAGLAGVLAELGVSTR